MPQRKQQGFIWVPKPKDTVYSIWIDGEDMTSEFISASFTSALIGFGADCTITLIDSDGALSEKYQGGEEIELKLDFNDGSTSQWKGTLERPKRRSVGAYLLEIKASPYQADLLDITVSEQYSGNATSSEILIAIITKYLPGFTYANVSASDTRPTIKWDNKPFWDCVVDLCNVSGYDCYVSPNKDFHFFLQASRNNDDEAIVWDDNLIAMDGLGPDIVDIRNRIIVYGDDGSGLPIYYQADDLASQQSTGKIKEKIIKDSSISTYQQAKELGDAELARLKSTVTSGNATCIILPDIRLGEMTYVIHPVLKVHNRYRVVKYTHYLPDETTTAVFSLEKNIPLLFKERKNAELATEKIINPYGMQHSYNFTFDGYTNVDEALSDHIMVSEGFLKVSEGTSGTMISKLRIAESDITKVYVLVVGDYISDSTYQVSTDDGKNWTDIILDSQITVPPGRKLRLKAIVGSANTWIDSILVGYK